MKYLRGKFGKNIVLHKILEIANFSDSEWWLPVNGEMAREEWIEKQSEETFMGKGYIYFNCNGLMYIKVKTH